MVIYKLKYFFVFVLIVGLLCQCHKYRDDELINFKSPFKRLTAHAWSVTWFGVNGQDSTNQLYTYNGTSKTYKLGGEVLTFGTDIVNTAYGYYYADGAPVRCVFWKMEGEPNKSGNNSDIFLGVYEDFAFRVPWKTKWTILKLTNNDFHISTTYNNKNYEIYFAK